MLGRCVVVAALAATPLAACSDDDETGATLGPLSAPGGVTVSTSTSISATTAAAAPIASPGGGSTAPADAVGSGFVSIRVRLAASGIDEALTLDRASVPADQLDPLSVDAYCTALDDGDGWTVSVTDLRRMSVAPNRLVSAALRIEADVAAPGTYEGSLEVGDAEQHVTRYEGTISVGEGLATGTFDVRDPNGGAATGTFVCAEAPVATTTVPAAAGTGPLDSVPQELTTGPTAPPPPTVPEATS